MGESTLQESWEKSVCSYTVSDLYICASDLYIVSAVSSVCYHSFIQSVKLNFP